MFTNFPTVSAASTNGCGLARHNGNVYRHADTFCRHRRRTDNAPPFHFFKQACDLERISTCILIPTETHSVAAHSSACTGTERKMRGGREGG